MMTMEYRRRSLGVREYSPVHVHDSFSSGTSFTSLSSSGSPVLSRRRSASPLYSAFNTSNSHLQSSSLLERNRKEASFPQTEDEHLYLFHERIIWNQEQSLLPLAHDLADWLNSILGLSLTPGTLMQSLETGETLYKLGKLVESKAQLVPDAKLKPKVGGRMRVNARKGSFFARDNIAMFLKFCKDLGVHSNLLFETEDLVSHGEIRNILICLMEVGRLATKYGIEPPALVAMEHQIDREAADNQSQRTTTTDDEEAYSDEANKENPKLSTKRSGMTRIPIKASSTLKLNLSGSVSDSLDSGLPDQLNETKLKKTQLDLKVSEVARISGNHCCCVEETRNEFRLRKLSEGKYLINGRTVFVRLLKGVHVMVRIGGGWETLEEFLVRNDPCRNKGGNRENGGSARRSSFGVFNHYGAQSTSSSAQSTPVTPCVHVVGHPLLQRPMSTPPTTGQLRTRIPRQQRPSFSACSTPTTRSQHSSRNSLLI